MSDFYTKEQRCAYNRKRREALKNSGMCQDCGYAPVFEGKTLCVGCLDDRMDREILRRQRLKGVVA